MRKAFTEKQETKIILATNIAESSVTIPHCSHIIDFCLTKELKYDSKSGIERLLLNWASKSSCN